MRMRRRRNKRAQKEPENTEGTVTQSPFLYNEATYFGDLLAEFTSPQSQYKERTT